MARPDRHGVVPKFGLGGLLMDAGFRFSYAPHEMGKHGSSGRMSDLEP